MMTSPLTERLGIRHPVLLAPMAGGAVTAELAGAVTRAGGLCVLPLTGLTLEQAGALTRRAVELGGGGPMGVNVLLAPSTQRGDPGRTRAFLATYRAELGSRTRGTAARSSPRPRRPS